MRGTLKLHFIIYTLLLTVFVAKADITVSEIMPCNISTLISDQYNFSGWVEFYNSGASNVNLKGSEIICYKNSGKVKWTWAIDYDCPINSKAYKVIFFDKKTDGKGNTLSGHSPYKLDADGGKIEIYATDGSSSSITYPALKPHVSYGIYNANTYGYMEPTPGVANSVTVSDLTSGRCAAPTFSGTQPGLHTSGNNKITLSCATPDATIYYTTDGSEPNTESTVYTTGITLDKTRCIRARAYKKGMLYSEITTGSFIIYGSEHNNCSGENAAIVSITTNDEYFYGDQLGIYVTGKNGIEGARSCVSSKANYNQDWSRPVNFEYILNGKQVVSQEAEVGVMGGCSRQYDVKSLKISTGKKTGNQNFAYNFFGDHSDKADNQYASVQLRNGGNAHQTGYVRCRDGFMQSIARQMGNIDYQAYQPVAYYLNGKYLGMMGLRERTNKEYVYSNYGIDEDDIDVIEITGEQKYVATTGDTMGYHNMVAYAVENYNNENFLSGISDYMDIEEYLNYMIFEQFIVNTDWPGNNCKLWRQRVGGKFRWILFDTDFGFGLYGSGKPNYCDVNLNMIEWCMGTGKSINWANGNSKTYTIGEQDRWKTIFFNRLMQNDDFKMMYLTKSLIHLSTTFKYDNVKSIWDKTVEKASKEYCATFGKSLENDGKSMLNFAKERVNVVYKQLADFYGVKNTLVDLKVKSNDKKAGFYLNNAEINSNSYTLSCLQGMKVKIAAKLPDGYMVDRWVVGSKEYNDQESIEVTMSEATTVTLYTKEENYDIPNLFINEVCAKNSLLIDEETQSTPDWIEIYNAGDKDVDIAGFYISDVDSLPTLHQIAKGYTSTIIPAKGHIVLWADGNKNYGPMHVDFKLSNATGETLTLTKVTRDSVMTVDRITFEPHGENNSYGRVTDGASTFQIFYACQDGENMEATPGAANGSVSCEELMKANMIEITLSSPTSEAGFVVNGKRVEENTYAHSSMKGQTVSLSPIIPEGMIFDRWEYSKLTNFSDEILNKSTQWSYYYEGNQPSTTWSALSYDDTEWKTGSGKFGYAKDNSSYNTVLDYGVADDKYLTAYFRTKFDVQNKTDIKELNATITFDDAYVVYLNGAEVARYNMPDGNVAYKTRPSNYTENEETRTLTIPTQWLRNGENVIAVEIHQCDNISSDMTFKMNMTATGSTNNIFKENITISPSDPVSLTLYLKEANVGPSEDDITITIASNTPNVGYNINGTNYFSEGTVFSYTTTANSELTITPIMPEGKEFAHWGSSQTIDQRIDTTSLLTAKSNWKYYYQNNGPKGDWRSINYVDTIWTSGFGLMGYSDEVNVDTKLNYGKDKENRYITAYFRTTFEIEDINFVNNLIATLTYDDGAAIYVNGEEVKRFNVGGDELTYDYLTSKGGNETVQFTIDRRYLRNGANVIAVEVHQNKPTSTDLLFQLNARITKIVYTEEDNWGAGDPTITFTAGRDSSLTLITKEKPEGTDTPDATQTIVSVYPNPCVEKLTVSTGEAGRNNVSLYNSHGQILFQTETTEPIVEIDTNLLPAGIYHIRIANDNHQETHKVMKR